MRSIKGSETEKLVLTAFAGESQARNRYTYFAGVARKEGFVQIADIFLETADQEKEHAKRMFKFLEGGEVSITWAFPAGIIAPTVENLRESAAGERHEYSEMYPMIAQTAAEEGFEAVAVAFNNIAKAEKFHEERYLAFLDLLEKNRAFKREEPVFWRCRNCGMVHHGLEAPQVCPACLHPQAHFEILCKPW